MTPAGTQYTVYYTVYDRTTREKRLAGTNILRAPSMMQAIEMSRTHLKVLCGYDDETLVIDALVSDEGKPLWARNEDTLQHFLTMERQLVAAT